MELQDHINQEAKNELEKKIINYLNNLTNDELFDALRNVKTESGESFHSFFFPHKHSSAFELIFKKFEDKYIDDWTSKYYHKLKMK